MLIMQAECKRINPVYSDWCFVKSPFINRNQSENDKIFILESLLRDDDIILNFVLEKFRVNEDYHTGFSVKKSKSGASTGETGQAIEDASTQVLRGLNGFIETMNKENWVWSKSYRASFLPVIFTTAELFVSDTDISRVDLQTGEVILSKDEVKSVPCLYFQYSMSPGLKHLVGSEKEVTDLSSLLISDYVRTIPIVSATGVEDFLMEIPQSRIGDI